MRRLALHLALALALTTGATALAAGNRKVQEFTETEMTDEERAEAQNRGRHRVTSWHEDQELPKERPFPWMAFGLCVGLLAIATPFAWGAYKRTSQELKDADAFGTQPATPRRTRTKD
jgi:hypothetical protein